MSWAALFERAAAYAVEETAVCDALAARRGAAPEPNGDAQDEP